MAAQTVTLGGKRYVILPEREYQTLRTRSANGKISKAKPRPKVKRVKMTNQDWGDVAEAKRRMADPNEKPIPWSQVRDRL